MYIKRHVEKLIKQSEKAYPVVLISGPRQVGKSTVLRTMYPNYNYDTLDDLKMNQAISSDPLGYLKLNSKPLIIDEIQKVPELFSSIKYIVDAERKNGSYLLTGSQKFTLMKGASESLSGRISIINLLGLSLREIQKDENDEAFLPTTNYLSNRKPYPISSRTIWEIIHKGSMPALYDNLDLDWQNYYSNYVTTYIERDIHQLLKIENNLTFLQFLTILASRTGELLNMDSIAKNIGVSAPTIKKWISILEATNIIYLLRPFSLNATRRIVKTPKIYFLDTGLVCYLCKWLTTDTLINGAQAGSIFETFVVSEIIKTYYNKGKEPNIYFYRDSDKNEIDLIFYNDGNIYPVEIKTTSSPNLKDIKHFNTLKKCFPTIKIEEGGLICTQDKILPLGENNKIIPINYI